GLLLGNTRRTNRIITYIAADLPIGVITVRLRQPRLANYFLSKPVSQSRAQARVYIPGLIFNEIYFYRSYRIRDRYVMQSVRHLAIAVHNGDQTKCTDYWEEKYFFVSRHCQFEKKRLMVMNYYTFRF